MGTWGSASFLERPLNDSSVFTAEPLENSVGVNGVGFLAFFMIGLGFSLFKSAVKYHLPICFISSVILLPLLFHL